MLSGLRSNCAFSMDPESIGSDQDADGMSFSRRAADEAQTTSLYDTCSGLKNERVPIEKRDAQLLFSTDLRIVSDGRASHKRA